MSRPSPESTLRSYTWLYTSGNPTQNTSIPGTDAGVYTYMRTYTGAKNPSWPRVKVPLPYSLRYHYANYVGCTVRRTNTASGPNWWDQRVDQSITTMGLVTPPGTTFSYSNVFHDTALKEKTLGDAMDAVLDSKFNFAQFIAEREQVSNMVADTVKRIEGCARALRRRDYSGAAKALGLSRKPKNMSGQFSRDWLAMQYGWKPLLSDVKSAAEHLAANHLGRPALIKIRKKRKSETPAFIAETGVLAGGNPWCKQVWSYEAAQHWCTVELWYEVTNDYLRQSQQLGITDPLLLGWELLPYSFVVDWFIPVGNFLQRLNFDSGLTFKQGYCTQFSTQTVWVTPISWKTGTWNNSASGGSSRIRNLQHDREVYYSSPRVALPRFKDPFSSTHVANALALLRVAFKR